MRWSMRYKQWIKIEANSGMHLTAFKFIDRMGEEIKL
jgi:hypothetical protein